MQFEATVRRGMVVLAAALAMGGLLAFAGGFGVPAARAQDEARGVISSGTLFKSRMEVQDWTYQDTPRRLLATGEACEDVLVQDLTYSDFFRVERQEPFAALPGDSALHAPPRAVATGTVRRRGGQVVLEGQLTDPSSGKLIFARTYILEDPPERWTVHAFSDDIVLYLTGERGVAETRIAYVGDATGNKEIYLVDYDGARVEMKTNLQSISLSPRWSPDGNRLAFTTFAHGNPELAGLDLRNGRLWPISARPGMNSAPCWSPDGDHLLASLSFEGNSELYLLDATGRNPRRLTFSPSIETSPTWSPKGNQIAFTSDRSGEPQIFVMDADGTNVRRLTFVGKHSDSPDWSPKGDRILFVSLIDKVFDICSIRPDGSDLVRLTGGDGNHENPRWAPDGRHLTFAMRQNDSRRLFVMAADGSGIRQLTWSRGDQYNPAWSPPLSSK